MQKGPCMITLYVTTTSTSCWHILRPNQRDRVWCLGTADNPTWKEIRLNVPSAVCSVCCDAEKVSVTSDLDRVPVLASVF